MAFDKSAFLAEVLNGVQLDPAQKAAFEAALDNPIVARKLEEGTMRQSEFSKKLDDYNKKVQAAQDYHSQLVTWQKQEQERLEAERKNYKREGEDTDLDLSPNGRKGLTSEDVDKKAQEIFMYTNAINQLQAKHLKEFNEVLTIQDVLDVAAKQGTNINIAYDLYVKGKRDELQKADFDRQLLEAKKQGAEEALRNANLPTISAPLDNSMPHNVIDNLNRKAGEGTQYGAMSAVQAWEQARREGTLTKLPF